VCEREDMYVREGMCTSVCEREGMCVRVCVRKGVYERKRGVLSYGKGGKGTNLSGACFISTLYDKTSFRPYKSLSYMMPTQLTG